ncbi:MAG TPA: glycosyltransferase family 4 protein [Acidimicrobiales bacterium]
MIAPPWLPVPPPAYGGTERVLDDLCRALAAAGHDVLLYATGDSTCPVETAWTYRTALGTVRVSPAAELRHVLDAYEAAVAWGAEVVHDHTMSGPFLPQRHHGTPVVTTNHGPFDDDLTPLYRRLAPDVPVIAISHHQASTAPDIPVAAVVHHGVTVDDYPIGPGGGPALFLGRMTPDKGVDRAIRIARAAGVPLLIAAKLAEPAERAYFAEKVEPLLGGDVEYLGEVGGEEKLQLLGEASCLLNPIGWPEPFGLVMAESLACGTPIVATPCGAAPEIVEDGVTGFIRSDDAGLVEAVRAVADLDRSDCRRAAKTRFSADRMAADHVAVYTKATARRDAPRHDTRHDGRRNGRRPMRGRDSGLVMAMN